MPVPRQAPASAGADGVAANPFQRAWLEPADTRPCDLAQLAFKPFVANDVVLAVGEDRTVREVALGGAGRFESLATLTLFVPPGTAYLVGSNLTVNLLPAARGHDAGVHFENSDSVPSPARSPARS